MLLKSGTIDSWHLTFSTMGGSGDFYLNILKYKYWKQWIIVKMNTISDTFTNVIVNVLHNYQNKIWLINLTLIFWWLFFWNFNLDNTKSKALVCSEWWWWIKITKANCLYITSTITQLLISVTESKCLLFCKLHPGCQTQAHSLNPLVCWLYLSDQSTDQLCDLFLRLRNYI